ncbi:MAG: TIM barrel protein [Candidatus Brocadiia bacterium]
MLHFGPAGLPARLPDGKDYRHAIPLLRELGLDAIEVEFVHGARMNPNVAREVGAAARDSGIAITVHAPYYINLNAREPDKRERSVNHILASARLGKLLGAKSVTFHAAFFLGMPREQVHQTVISELGRIAETLIAEDNPVLISPELTGKPVQWGSLEEILGAARAVPQVWFCVDFAHLHARTGGGWNSYEDFSTLLRQVSRELGSEALRAMHMHVAGIEFTSKGEKKHLNLEKSDFRYVDLLRALRDYAVEGSLICESPNLEEDAMLLAREFREPGKEAGK